MRQYETFELTFSGKALREQWSAVDLTAEFTCGGETKTVKGFYDGGGQYKVRFLPEQSGEYTWKVSGVVRSSGKETCVPAQEAHGPVRAVGTHFEYASGAPFFPFGTTVYALASQDGALVDRTIAALKDAPFNKIRMGLMSPAQIKEKLDAGYTPGDFTWLALSSIERMQPDDRAAHLASEHVWRARCGEEAFLQFFGIQISAECTFDLPEDKAYKAELIDVWEMTRTALTENTSGKTTVRLPGKEGMAVLITRTA